MTLMAKETAVASMAGPQPSLVPAAIAGAFRKLNPRELASNPVMFVTELSAIAVTLLALTGLDVGASAATLWQISIWLWFTVLFANFAESFAQGRGKARAETLRMTQSDTMAKLIGDAGGDVRLVQSRDLKTGDIALPMARRSRASPR